ncbi:hypothetical protein CLOM_g8751 [Closterium sp. NIES-68]|nr:hypothetical protein CLOM_g8751 [Closterium sp. NIES-68]GJP64780.1 hypothetical protein CLOP_g21727 [Closterium sp. NIES-67]
MVVGGDWRQRAVSALREISHGSRGAASGCSSNSNSLNPSRGEGLVTFARFTANLSSERLVPLLLCALVTLLSSLLLLLLVLTNPSSLSRSALITPATTAFLRFSAGSSSKVLRCPVNMSDVTRSTSMGTDSDFPRPVPWAPRPGKFLLATCVQGQLTNRQLCVHKTLFLAMLLNRTLILPRLDVCPGSGPSHKLYDLALTMDVAHLAQCFKGVGGANQGPAGAGAAATEFPAGDLPANDTSVVVPGVMTLETYLQAHNSSVLEVDELACGLVPDPSACADLRKCSSSFAAHLTPITFPSNVSRMLLPQGRLADLASRLAISAPNTVTARVLCLGDPFGLHTLEFSQNTAFLPPAFLPTSCGLPLRPPSAVVDAAAWFMQEYLGRDFAALHLRRKDFLGRFFSNPGKSADYFPLTAVAECVAERIRAASSAAAVDSGAADGNGGASDNANGGGLASFERPLLDGRQIRAVFLCTDAGEKQVETLSRLLEVHGITLMRMNMIEDLAFQSSGVDRKVAESPDAAAMVEKVIAANARLVLYARGSSFSGQIRYLRRSLGLESCWDEFVCEGKGDGLLSLSKALVGE